MNILIADDEANIRLGIEKRIKRLGLQPIDLYFAADGLDAKQLLDNKSIDLAFMDINMPFLNGLDLIQSYCNKGVLFVIISGYDNFEYARKALQYGVFRYLLKPIDKDEFNEVVFAAIDKLNLDLIATKHSDDLNTIIKVMHQYYVDESFSLEYCASLSNMSKRQISKVLNQELNQTFTELLNKMRIDRAVQLLNCDLRSSMAQIANECGFINQQYFSSVFKKVTGKPPLTYLKDKNKNS